MKNISTFNKIFLILCAVLFLLLAMKAPHEKDGRANQQQEVVNDSE